MELRTIQDWVVRREMLGTPGVADINSYGGFVKEYEIAVNPERLRGMNLTLSDLFDALEKNNENTGSAYIDKNPNAYFIRGIGLVKSLEDIEKIVVKTNPSGIPVLIRDVATVGFGTATRYGAFVVDTSEAVGGVVMMLKGANAHKVIDNVQTRIASVQKSLPAGVTIEPYLNRSDLVSRAIGTVSRNLLEGCTYRNFHPDHAAWKFPGRIDCCLRHTAFDAVCHLDDEHFWGFRQPDEPGSHRFRAYCRWRRYHCR